MVWPKLAGVLDVSLDRLAFSIAFLAVAGILWIPIYNVFLHPLRSYPGPWWLAASRIPWFVMVYSGEAPHRILELHMKYGRIVRVAPDELSYVEPEAWKDVTGHRKTAHGENGKDPGFYKGAIRGLVGAPKARHTLMRKTLASGFSSQAMVQQQPYIMKYADLLIQKLRDHCDDGCRALDMAAWLNWATFDIIGDLTFGESFRCLEEAAYHPWVAFVFERMRLYVVHSIICRLPIPSEAVQYIMPKSTKERAARHLQFATEKVHKRLAWEAPRPDFLESLKSQDDISVEETCIIASQLIGAGSETAAAVLTGAVYLLAKHDDARVKLEKEIREGFKSEAEIDIHSVQKMEYLLAVLDETLRVYPPVPWGMPRVTQQGGDTICGRFVPEGTILGIWQYAINRYPGNFAQPESFAPERWLGDPRFANDRRDACQPFSFGPRNCIGQNLAHAEMRLILARFTWNFDIRLADDSEDWFPRDDHKAYVSWKRPALNIFLTPRHAV